MASQHRIGRLVFDIGVPEAQMLDGFSAMLRSRFGAVVAPALESALERVERPGRLLRYDRIEIDLGRIAPDALVADELARRLADGLAYALATPGTHADAAADDDAEELIRFLRSGVLPWAQPGPALAALTRSLLERDAREFQVLAERLRSVLIARAASLRLVRQFPAILLCRLLLALLPPAQAASVAAIFGAPAAAAADVATPLPAALADALAQMLRRLADGRALPEAAEVVALYAALLPGAAGQAYAAPQQAPGTPAANTPAVRAPQATVARPAEGKPAEAVRDAALHAALPVYAAGSVLLHPFLPAFYARLGLLDPAGAFLDEAAQIRAVLLAHYLASGADDAPEPETVLFKLLCGMAFDVPLPRRMEPTPTERAEAGALLASVIAHWGRLGNTTADGLREGFLLRPGLLQRHGEHWRLRVEPSGIDVLLERLPWGLGQVKTPFMRHLLTVEWR